MSHACTLPSGEAVKPINKYNYSETSEVALAGAELTTRQGTKYRVFVGWNSLGSPQIPASLVWTAFKKNENALGEAWERVPCFTDAEEKRFPRAVASLGQDIHAMLGDQLAGKTLKIEEFVDDLLLF
jgi:hypothetical protein